MSRILTAPSGVPGLRALLAAATMLAGLTAAVPGHAGGSMSASPNMPPDVTWEFGEHTVPRDVRAAVAALSQACKAWPQRFAVARSSSDASPRQLVEPVPPLRERHVCDLATDPDRATSSLLWRGGILGAVLTVIGLIGFCGVRLVLLSLWHWRPYASSRSW